MGKKHKSPSRIRYEQKNPVFSIRMPKEWHVEYELYVKNLGLSRREFMGSSLDKIKINYINVKTQGIKEGFISGKQAGLSEGKKIGYAKGHVEAEYIYEKLKDQNKLWYYCTFCGELKFIERNSPEHYFIIEMLRQNGWGHSGCIPH